MIAFILSERLKTSNRPSNALKNT